MPRWEGFFRGLAEFASALAGVLRILAYGGLAVALVFALHYLMKKIGLRATRDGTQPRAPPETLFGLDVRPETLPRNLAELAAQLAARDPLAALSLLYRGALATLIHRDRLDVKSGDTEGDCVARVRTISAPALSDYFSLLVAVWSRAAYARQTPSSDEVSTLCRDWPLHFKVAEGSA